MATVDEPLAAWEWAVLLATGAVTTLGTGLLIAGFFALALAAAGGLDRLVVAWRGPRLSPRRLRLARRAARRLRR
jgi:hypothetical protein